MPTSRLKKASSRSKKTPFSRFAKKEVAAAPKTPNEPAVWQKWLKNYWQFSQLLVVAAFFYLLVFLLMKNVPPQNIANFPLPGVYLPFQLLLFGGNFFLFTFLWQNKKLGLVTAGLVASLLFWKLQGVLITPIVFLATVVPWLIAAVLVIWHDFKGIIKTL